MSKTINAPYHKGRIELQSQRKDSLLSSVAALQAFLREPPVLTPEEAQELNRLIQAERARGLTDFRNPLSRR